MLGAPLKDGTQSKTLHQLVLLIAWDAMKMNRTLKSRNKTLAKPHGGNFTRLRTFRRKKG
jgi:hypothetical protein